MQLEASSTPSAFDPSAQLTSTDAKIVAAVERLGQALRVLLWEGAREVGRDSALSPIQVQTLVFLLFHDGRLARVGELAREFALTPATVSDAVSALERKGFVEKARSEHDRRQFVLRLTPEGAHAARRLAHWAAPLEAALAEVPEADKLVTMRVLLDLIAHLQDQGIVQTTRMCQTCRFFGRDAHPDPDAPHHCHLIDRPLATQDLRLDCPEHQPV